MCFRVAFNHCYKKYDYTKCHGWGLALQISKQVTLLEEKQNIVSCLEM